jgi:uncharacterized protein (TIGR00369 family)
MTAVTAVEERGDAMTTTNQPHSIGGGTETGRSGVFWDTAAGRAPLPRAAATLGLEVIHADCRQGAVQLAFTATEDFTTPLGDVLGGFQAAMLYDTVGPAVLAMLPPDQFIATLDLTTTFLRPAFPGRLVGRGQVLHRDGDIVFVEATLSDPDNVVVATATATIRVIDLVMPS